MDCLGVCLSNWAAVWLAGEELLFTTGKGRYWSHHPWPTGTERDTRAEVKCDYFLSLFHSLLVLFHSPSPPRLPWVSVKGSFMDLRVQGAVTVQHLEEHTGQNSQNHNRIISSSEWNKGAVTYLWWHWCGKTGFSMHCRVYHCTHIIKCRLYQLTLICWHQHFWWESLKFVQRTDSWLKCT